MELDSKHLSRLQRVANPRDVWTSEAGDFTPWLAENIDVLAETLGMSLSVIATEVAVGEFRLDIHAEDADGATVFIENQLERTDHSHLGQCLVYASGLDASTIIWVAPSFREDFRRAFEWLNERSDLGVNFFGVEVGIVQIGDDGPRAPVFDVVARPNDWQKAVKAAAGVSGASSSSISPINAQRQDLFAEILADVNQVLPSIRLPARGRGNWVSFASGPFGSWALTVTSDGKLRAEAYLDLQDQELTKKLFDSFYSVREQVQADVGMDLTWERLDEKRASRIARYIEIDLDDTTSTAAACSAAVSSLTSMFNRLNSPLRDEAKHLRQAAAATRDAAEASAQS